MYFFNTPADEQAMLESIGVESIADLFASIPPDLRLQRELQIPGPYGELELTQHLQNLGAKNLGAGNSICFLGGGSYDHFIPAVVDTLASRGEFYTSYTPYQPEVSQGNLQAMFEYQTLICRLTGMDVSNASLYEGGSACIEAVLMAMSVTKRMGKVVVLGSLHPEYRQIASTYLEPLDTEIVTVDAASGKADVEAVAAHVDEHTACVVVQHPNFFGCFEDVEKIAALAHDKGALLVQVFDPISLGLLKGPGHLGADIAVAEGQSLGTPLQYGGPYLGIMACREKFIRRLPGRIAGQTVDRRGRRCWVLTLQTREQHIRRDKATSNICTNQGLFALRAAIYLAAMGPRGLKQAAELSLHKAHYAQQTISASSRFTPAFDTPFFKEFVIRDADRQVNDVVASALAEGILAGIPLGTWYPELEDALLVAVTEQRTKQEIDRWASCLNGATTQSETIHA